MTDCVFLDGQWFVNLSSHVYTQRSDWANVLISPGSNRPVVARYC